MRRARVAVLDVDGTLVDTSYQHALAWFRAFREHGMVLPLWQVHRRIGMGGDQIVPSLGGDEVEQQRGDALRAAWRRHVDPLLEEVAPLPGARELLVALKDRGHVVVLASSGAPDHVDLSLQMLDARGLADAWTTSEDVSRTKPAPDLLQVALGKVDGDAAEAVMVGDAPWDFLAAQALGVPGIGVRTGGYSADELRAGGAVQVFDSPADLRAALDTTPLM